MNNTLTARKSMASIITQAKDGYLAAVRSAFPIGCSVVHKSRYFHEKKTIGEVVGYRFFRTELSVFIRINEWQVIDVRVDELELISKENYSEKEIIKNTKTDDEQKNMSERNHDQTTT